MKISRLQHTSHLKNIVLSIVLLTAVLLPHSANAQSSNTICTDTTSTGDTGSLTDSGGSGSDYSNYEDCEFLIQPTGGGDITLSFSAFDYEENYDFVSIYDGTSTSSTLLGEFDGSSIPADLTATSGSMLIVNETDYSIVESGFQATWASSEVCEATEGLLEAVGVKIDSSGSNTQINTTTEALEIYDAWIAAGSPATGLIDGGTYNVAASGTSTADRLDFGGRENDYADSLPYPGLAQGVDGEDFIIHTSGTISLPAGDYTIYAETDDGFSFVMETVSGDDVTFNKFGSSSAGASNELRYENPTGNSNTGGSFTLTQESVFEIAAIFFERGGGDYLEISISNDIRTNSAPSGYEILRHGALGDKVQFGDCGEQPSPTPLLEYQFEESSWNGDADEVIDSSGNDHHGQVISNSEPENSSPAIAGNPGTCGYSSQNYGSIGVSGLPLDTATDGVKTTVTFWMNWDGTNNTMPIGWNYHDIWIVSGSMGFNTYRSDIYGISSSGLANGWHHVAAEFTNGSVTDNKIHIDGVEQVLTQRRSSPNNSRAYVNSNMRIGGSVNSSGYRFYGLLDEFRVYEGSLSTDEIVTIMNETHACDATPDIHHYEIVHDGEGLTCEADTVTIKACADENCTNLIATPVTVDFLADGNVISNQTFTGSTTTQVSHTVAETITFSLSNSSIATLNPLVCDDSVGNSCDMVFSDAGFRFLYGASNSTTIANQTSGALFGDSLKIQAVKDVDGVCTALFSGDKSIELSQENVDPGGTGGLSFTVNGADISKHSGTTTSTVTFGAESIGTLISPIYNDAGQIRLHASYNQDGISLTGTSNSFWVSPAELVINAVAGATVLNGATSTSATTYPAGEDFNLSVSAYNAATPAVITPNYSPGQIQLKVTRTGPVLGDSVDGEFKFAISGPITSSATAIFQDANLSDFTSGVSSYDLARYTEVGLLSVDVQDSDYGNVGINIPATPINIGRFIPDYFTQTIAEDGLFMAQCNAQTSFTAYSGQMDEATLTMGAISYLTNPILAITAYNKQGDITQNYYQDSEGSANDFMKLSASNITINQPTTDEVAVGIDATKLPITANMSLGILSQSDLTDSENNVALPKGVLHYQLSDDDNFYYQRSANAKVSPFTSDIDFTIAAIVDADTVSASSTMTASPEGLEIRFGRLVLENSFGDETANFPQVMHIQHYDGDSFTPSSGYNCTSYNADNITLSNISLDPNLTNVLGGTGSFVSGQTQSIELEALELGVQGQMGVLYDAYYWLQFDWDNDGAFDDNPTAVASFGLYHGDDRMFHWREVFD